MRALFVVCIGMIVIAIVAGCGSNGSTATPEPPHAVLQTVYAFRGLDGAWARGSLVRSGDTLFGRTSLGGAANNGTVFSVDTNGGNFFKIYDFPAGSENIVGNQPHHNAMLLSGQTLVGAALYGGNENGGPLVSGSTPGPVPPAYVPAGNGTLFTVHVDGTGYTTIRMFNGPPADACSAHSPPVFSRDGSFLYGMTAGGGANNMGTIFSVNPDGSNFQILYSFEIATGAAPHGQVTFDSTGTLLLGMTRGGGSTGAGVIFSFDPQTSTYNVLWTFASGDQTNGNTNDHGFLTRIGTTMYGTTEMGGAQNEGVVFFIDESGGNLNILHSFGAGSDGQLPFGSLVLVNGLLYGTTRIGGAKNAGTVFSIDPAGNNYSLLASFDPATTGAYPEDNVTPDDTGSYLYGQTQAGGAFDPNATLYYGTVFRLSVQ